MTATVKKGTNRPAAQARANRHAQRTPLPPKAARADDVARLTQAQEPTTAGEQYGRMTVLELQARAKVLEIKPIPRNKGALLTAILEAERQDRFAEQVLADVVQQGEEERAAEVTAAAAPLKQSLATSFDSKGAAKARRLHDDISAQGWDMNLTGEGARLTATYTRRDVETLVVTWDGGVYNYEESAYLLADRTTRVRNVSQARQFAMRAPAEAEKELKRVVANKAWKRKPTGDGPARSDQATYLVSASDDELRTALVGMTVEWQNRLTNVTETATISKDPRFFKIVRHNDDRVVQFCSDLGFRAFRLSALVRVGGSRRRAKAA